MPRQTLTNKAGKALCMEYRNGKRCNRVARFEATFTTSMGLHHETLCRECMGKIQEWEDEGVARDLSFVESPKGFRVEAQNAAGWIRREYVPIA